ncbi:substrate-binding domain-containing protein [Variovorax boronicumulans]|uniref:substrate-binding domain-containing protein n=1 Tax=Variovorax boronicumulans TaxID=436515 RepID=UPI00214BA254
MRVQSRLSMFNHRKMRRSATPFHIQDWDETAPVKDRDVYSIGLFVPTLGVAGIWGPSAIACATLAAEEINRTDALQGRTLALRVFDASDECDGLVAQARSAVCEAGVDAIVGMHTSSVRKAILEGSQGRVPYVYTALHEGRAQAPGLYAIGETPERQLRPAIDMFVRERSARRWMFIGNDYEWPRVSHQLARHYVAQAGGQVLCEHYVPFGTTDLDAVLQAVEDARPDALLLSLVGQDAVDFNRAFGQSGLDTKTLRLSCAVEENMLLAIGAANTRGLYVSSGYFGALGGEANAAFKERYQQRFGARAPTLNALGQSTYEGIHFAAALAARSLLVPGPRRGVFGGVRGINWQGNDSMQYPVHLAQADGHFFEVIRSF